MAEGRTRTLLLLRHGRTEWNRVDRAQGHADVPLDAVGRAQAEAVAPLLAALGPTRIWSSDLTRAAETAAYLGHACGLPVEEDKRLREYSVGERQGLTWPEAVARFPWIDRGQGSADRPQGIPGAESDDDVSARIVPALEELLAALGPGETGVAVTHGAAMKLALADLLGWDRSMLRTLKAVGNCHWATVLVGAEGGLRRLGAYGVGDFASAPAIG